MSGPHVVVLNRKGLTDGARRKNEWNLQRPARCVKAGRRTCHLAGGSKWRRRARCAIQHRPDVAYIKQQRAAATYRRLAVPLDVPREPQPGAEILVGAVLDDGAHGGLR